MIAYVDVKHEKRAKKERELAQQIKIDTDNKIDKKDVDTQAAVQALLRDKIVDRHAEYMRQGYVDLYGRDSLNRMYVEYKNLGGNSLVDLLISELDELPTLPPKENHKA